VQVVTKLKDDYFATEQKSFFDKGAFGPVLKLLNDLITRLEEEAAAETSQHEWCETEKSTSAAAKKEREKILENLKASITSLTTEVAQLKTEVLFLESEIERVKEETRIAKQIRADEKAVYEQAKKDHEEVISAIGEALKALGGQYGFIQLKSKTHHKNQQKRQEPGGDSPFADYASGSAGGGSAMSML
jgi:septal ring factor EnvC (AmiA/AmiB activator)